jgi:hypothetical protein
LNNARNAGVTSNFPGSGPASLSQLATAPGLNNARNAGVTSDFSSVTQALSFNGLIALGNPTVRRQLNLSPDQIRQLRILSRSWRQQLQQLSRRTRLNVNSVDPAQWNQLQQLYASQLNGVLTPDQQQQWAQLTGQP